MTFTKFLIWGKLFKLSESEFPNCKMEIRSVVQEDSEENNNNDTF